MLLAPTLIALAIAATDAGLVQRLYPEAGTSDAGWDEPELSTTTLSMAVTAVPPGRRAVTLVLARMRRGRRARVELTALDGDLAGAILGREPVLEKTFDEDFDDVTARLSTLKGPGERGDLAVMVLTESQQPDAIVYRSDVVSVWALNASGQLVMLLELHALVSRDGTLEYDEPPHPERSFADDQAVTWRSLPSTSTGMPDLEATTHHRERIWDDSAPVRKVLKDDSRPEVRRRYRWTGDGYRLASKPASSSRGK